ncbi:YfjI family protein [Pseudomonas sp. LS44]|uniref:YfjI family protein n=1 Tax=Pseudomonas sp. LS44 TaxID=1357074 RepID=UPI00215ACAD0|nr:YfjI family protein [Pseudomonas sp. LS44]UVE18192.1 YfjI family protein [Pseudomonas sp. LS44]
MTDLNDRHEHLESEISDALEAERRCERELGEAIARGDSDEVLKDLYRDWDDARAARRGMEPEVEAMGIPPELTGEMPEYALLSYLNPNIQPRPLPVGLPSAMTWDYDLLPDALSSFVRDVAERTQCPPDFVSVALVVEIGSVVGRKFTIHPKRHDDWAVVPNPWGCVIGNPATMKSPALNQAMFPLQSLETSAREQHTKAMTEYKTGSELLELERKVVKDKARKLLENNQKVGAQSLLESVVEDIPPPIPRRHIVNDTTVEKLGELLNQNPNGLLLARDELSGWLARLQDERWAADRAFYLECSEGNGEYTYDRIGRGTLHISSCCLSIIGGIQPSRIASLVRGAVTGDFADGLMQRFQLLVWPDDNREWQLVDRWPNHAVREYVKGIFHDLDQLPDEPRLALHFTEEAQELFNTWYTEHMQEIRRGELHPALQAHFIKMAKTIVSLALLFELIVGGREAVGLVATARALGWADYLKSHAGRVYGAAINASLLGARLILERRRKLPEPFTPRDVMRKGWAGLDSPATINDALAILAEHHLVIRYEVKVETGGRPSARFVWRRTPHGPMVTENPNMSGHPTDRTD